MSCSSVPSNQTLIFYAGNNHDRYKNFLDKYFKFTKPLHVRMKANYYISREDFGDMYDAILEDEAVKIGLNWNWAINTYENAVIFGETVMTEVERRMDDKWKQAKKEKMAENREARKRGETIVKHEGDEVELPCFQSGRSLVITRG